MQNEVGWIFPIPEVAALRDELAPEALLHCDATQSFGKLPTCPREWGVQLLTAGAHKIGGPRGIGILYVQRGVKMFTTAFGGNQERGLRSGTEPVFLAAGMAEAVRLAVRDGEANAKHAADLRERAIAGLCHEIGDVVIHAPAGGSPYILSFSIPACRTHSRCATCPIAACSCRAHRRARKTTRRWRPGTWRGKHPLSLQAAGISLREGKETLRVSFFHQNTPEDVDRFVAVLAQCAREMRES